MKRGLVCYNQGRRNLRPTEPMCLSIFGSKRKRILMDFYEKGVLLVGYNQDRRTLGSIEPMGLPKFGPTIKRSWIQSYFFSMLGPPKYNSFRRLWNLCVFFGPTASCSKCKSREHSLNKSIKIILLNNFSLQSAVKDNFEWEWTKMQLCKWKDHLIWIEFLVETVKLY